MASRIRQHAALSALGMALAAGAAWAQGGGVNVEKYVAIGDSLTAAFSSGGLSIEQQADSYPALLHRAFQGVGGPTADFEQPLVSVPGLPAQLSLQGLFPTVIAPRSNQSGQPLNLGLQRPYDNLGVPGARMHDVAATVTNESNPLFDLVLRGAGTALQQALIQQPTFVTVQIGNNDVLAAATSGIVIDGVTLTPVASFEADLQSLVGALASSGAQIAIANLPNVTTVPFVTTIPPIVVDERGQPVLVNGEPVPLIGPDGPLGPNDHVLLPASSQALRFGIGIPPFIPGGTGRPLPDNLVLDAVETGMVQSRVAALNEAIAAVAEEHGAVLVDVNALFDGIVNNGLTLGGIDFSADFLTGGLFSYDGVHPTRLGYGVLANAFIEAINETFEVAVPLVDLERLAFEPPTSAAAADAGVHTTSADNRWTPFVYSREAWQNLQFALGINAIDTETPRRPGSPTPPDRPDQIRRELTPQQSSPGRANAVRPHSAQRRTPTTQPERLSRQSP